MRPRLPIHRPAAHLVRALVFAASLASTMPSVAAQEEPVIASAAEFWGLNGIAGDRVYRLRGRIDVLYYDSVWNVLWATWDGVGCYLPPGTKPLPLKSGQRVELDGFAAPGSQQILWDRTAIRVIDETLDIEYVPVPEPLERPLDYNLRPVSIEGLVCEQDEVDGTHSRIVMVSPGWRLTAQVFVQPDSPIPQFKGAFVRMRGMFSVKEDVTHRTADFEMWVSDVGHIQVLTWLETDPRFKLPATAAEEIVDAPQDRLVRIEGVVHAAEPGVSLTIRDSSGQARVMTRQPAAASPGDTVEAIGFPAPEGVESRLARGVVRPLRTDRSPTVPGDAVAAARSKLRLTEHVRRLDPAEAERDYPVDVRGVVTWTDPVARSFSIVDSSGGLEAMLPGDGSVAMPEFGVDVIVRGETRAGSFVPVVQARSVTIGMSRTLPAPKSITYEQAMTGALYGEWSEMHGYVQAVTAEPDGITRIDLTTPGGTVAVHVRGLAPDSRLVGSLIEARGICDVSVNSRRQLTGVRFLVASPDLIKVEQRPPADVFETAHRSIGSLLQFGAARDMNHRVQVSGVVAVHRPGAYFYLEDGVDHLLVLSRSEEQLRPGERVDVVGIPGNEAGRLVMRDAVYKRVGHASPPLARDLEEPDRSRTELDGVTVRLRGRLLDSAEGGSGTRLRLQHAETIFEANLPDNTGRTLLTGSVLEVTGVYRVQLDEYRQPRAFSLEVRSASDLRLVTRPSWWTPNRVFWTGSAMLIAVAFTAGWVLVLARKNQLLRDADLELQKANAGLERRVAERTSELAEASGLLDAMMDNLPDLIFFKDRESRFVRFSRSFARRLRIPDSRVIRGKTDFDFFGREHAQEAFDDEQEVMRTGLPMIGKLERENYPDGRITWALTTKLPWRDGTGAIIGLFGISTDVTGWKETEAKLAATHEMLLKTSRQAGMAEVATSVLHNVGNVLNSVNVSTTLAREILRTSEVATLALAGDMMRGHVADMESFLSTDPKGRLIPALVIQLAGRLSGEHARLTREVDHLAKNVEHIKSIVTMQQSYAKVSGVQENVRLAELMRDALQINAAGFARHSIDIVQDFEDLPEMSLDRHKVMQILVNLIKNAKHAISDARARGGRITVRIRKTAEDRVGVSITDNGVGIDPENLTKIFSHGFTTRTNGHGFGLHSGALAAREMGGSLHVESLGAGQGATFTLEFPIKTAEQPK